MKTTSIRAMRSNYGNKRAVPVKYIVFHYTGNVKGDTAVANGNYFKNHHVGASAHFFVDDKDIVQAVPVSYIGWHCGHDPGGIYYHKDCRNANSIGIEMCCTATKSGKGTISKKTAENAKELGIKYAREHKLGWNSIVRHYDVTHKACPAYWSNAVGVKGVEKWNNFKRDFFGGFAVGDKIDILETRTIYDTASAASSHNTGNLHKKGAKVTIRDLKYTKRYIWAKTSKGWIIINSIEKGDKVKLAK